MKRETIDMNSTRRVYTRNSTVHLCYEGSTFGPGREATSVSLNRRVKVEAVDAGHVNVRQGRTAEVWRKVRVPVNPRT